jgi:dCMP deaminase
MIYVTHQPCLTCAKMIINAGIERVVYAGHYPDKNSRRFLREAGVCLVQMPVPKEEGGGRVDAEQADGDTNR